MATMAGSDEALPSMISRASKTIFIKGITVKIPESSRVGVSANIPGVMDSKVTGTTYACASLKLLAKLVIASRTAEKNPAKRSKSAKICKIGSHPNDSSPNRTGNKPNIASVANIPIMFTTAVNIATVRTPMNLANSTWNLGTGAAISASNVPRSLSPAVRSMAG